jgi:isopenicillin-N N-acyltransferase-like protein
MTELAREPGRPALRLIDISGAPFERGRQFGRACGDLLRRYPAALRQVLADEARLRDPLAAVPDLDDDELYRRALLFLPWFERFAPEQVAEMRGVAAGAEVPFGLALLANVRAEVAGVGRFGPPNEGCTAIALDRAATADGSIIIAQNQDQHPAMRDLVVLLRVEPDRGPRMLMVTFPGLLAYDGINSAGIGYAMNALANSVWRMGLPHYPVKRALLQQESIAGCLGVFDRAPIGSCANNLLVDRDGIADVEATPDGYEVVRPAAGESFLVHTNHFLAPRLAADDQLVEKWTDSRRRYERARELLAPGAAAGKLTLADLKAVFADHARGPVPICRHPGADTDLATIFSVIGEPDAGRLHVCLGNPCAGEYQTFGI